MKHNIVIRAGGICIYNNKILLIHRINLAREEGSREYYVIPGGKVNKGEKKENAVARKMKEETDLDVKLGDLFYEMEDKDSEGNDKKHYYYACEYIRGEPKFRGDSEEAEEMKEGIHFYNPVWLDLSEIENIILYPREIKNEIISKFIKKIGNI